MHFFNFGLENSTKFNQCMHVDTSISPFTDKTIIHFGKMSHPSQEFLSLFWEWYLWFQWLSDTQHAKHSSKQVDTWHMGGLRQSMLVQISVINVTDWQVRLGRRADSYSKWRDLFCESNTFTVKVIGMSLQRHISPFSTWLPFMYFFSISVSEFSTFRWAIWSSSATVQTR